MMSSADLTFSGKRDDGMCLLPLRTTAPGGSANAHVCRRHPPPDQGLCRNRGRFEDSYEWKVTKSTGACLFRSLGRYYDELWFPTVIREWCMLFYRCNYAESDCYWQYKDEWLAGDEEVRLAIWSEVILYRGKYGGCQEEREIKAQWKRPRETNATGRSGTNANGADADGLSAEVIEMLGTIDDSNELIKLRRLDVKDLEVGQSPKKPTMAELKRAEAEAAEIALADPNDDPDWLDMRSRMRGSMSAFNLARTIISPELLNHMMLELCKYWSNAESVEHEVCPQLERNILREIQNFRFKLFNVTLDDDEELERFVNEPRAYSERQRSPPVVPPVCSNVRSLPPPPQQATTENNNRRAAAAAPRVCRGRGPGSNKLVEARAKLNAKRMRDFENRR